MVGLHSNRYKKQKNERDWFLSLEKEKNGFKWIIADKNTNKCIGDIGLFGYNKNHNRIELGFKLDKKYWRKGIMSKCINKVLDVGFFEKKYNRVEALVDSRNIGSKKH